MSRPCESCGTRFKGTGDWQRLCWECWRARKDREAHDRGYDAGRREALADFQELLQATVELCHPDRHPPERFEQANTVTAALLSLRKRVAA